jgi:glycerophosphoryl diester phosphodiesterase
MPRPQIVAHRGSAADRPENALSSFITAAKSGANQIELDVHLTADGELVVIHDATLDQTSEGHGPVSSLTLAELKRIRLRGLDETIPTLPEVLAAVGDRIHTRIEIKRNARGLDYEGLADPIMEAVESRNLKDRVTIMCFQLDSLIPFAKAGYETSLSFSKNFGSDKDLPSLVQRLAGEGISDIGYFFHELDQTGIETITSSGLTVGVWTVNGAPRLDYWLRQPISYILTDQADLAVQLAHGI